MAYEDFTETMFRGDTKLITLTITKNGAALNITGFHVWFTGKLAISDTDVQAIFQRSTINGGVTLTNAASGIATVVIRPIDTDSLATETILFCDAQMRDSSGNITTLATGKITVLPEITRSTAIV